ncbi:hypothetical protein Slala03_79150 [Streptomyces lavendulae subsp. lavendulae]|nr:hypothetical protein Slala03_79150 [Streptomyces lavendulae subsp. lavendulae]
MRHSCVKKSPWPGGAGTQTAAEARETAAQAVFSVSTCCIHRKQIERRTNSEKPRSEALSNRSQNGDALHVRGPAEGLLRAGQPDGPGLGPREVGPGGWVLVTGSVPVRVVVGADPSASPPAAGPRR